MITSSNFFQKALFEEDHDYLADWNKQRATFKISESQQQPKQIIVSRVNRSSFQPTQSPEIFRKQRGEYILPALSNQLKRTSFKESPRHMKSHSSKQYVEELNFIKQYVGERKKKRPDDESRKKFRYKTLDQPVHVNTRYVFSTKPLKDLTSKDISTHLSPEVSTYNFIRAARERLNRVRLSIA